MRRWKYHRFPLTARDRIADGRAWGRRHLRNDPHLGTRFGHEYARRLRRHQPSPGDRWQLDEVFVTIRGGQKYLWRSVEQHGNIADILILIQGKRDGKAATRFFKKILKVAGRRY